MEERNEMVNEETELANAEEEQTTNVVEDNFGSGLLIGGGTVLLAGVAVKAVKAIKKLRNKKTVDGDEAKVTKTHWYDKFKKHADPEESDEPIDVESSEVETEEEEE